MRIAVNVSPLSLPRTGIGNYVRGMVAGIVEASGGRNEVVCFAPVGPRGRQRIEAALAGLRVEVSLPVLPYAHYWRQSWSKLGHPALERFLGKFDVLHLSDWMYPPQRAGVRATTIHDLVPLRFPEWTTRRTRVMHSRKYRNAARTCSLVVVNSRFTGEDVAERLGVARERIHVAYPGLGEHIRPSGRSASIDSPYVLSVGTLEPRKNLPTLLGAFALLRNGYPELELVVVGARGWGAAPELVADGVRWLGYVDDDALAALYRGAQVFAFPSFFEGFGLPVLEALASGVPVAASAHPSLDEVCGDAAIRADPTSSEAFAAAIAEALERRSEVTARGLEHASRFTWRACGEAVLAGYASSL